MATREQIVTALLAQLVGAYAYKTAGRRLRDPENAAGDKRPALYVVEHNDEYKRPAPNLPPIRTMLVWAIVYTDAGADPKVVPATEQNNILDAIDTALAPVSSGDDRQTLGGLVFNCMIEGPIERASGDITGKGLLAVPIHIILP